MFPTVLALFGIQVTLAGVVFAVTGGAQIGAACAIVGLLIELLATSRADRPRRPTG